MILARNTTVISTLRYERVGIPTADDEVGNQSIIDDPRVAPACLSYMYFIKSEVVFKLYTSASINL